MKRNLVIGSIAVLLMSAVPIVGVWLVRRPLPALDGRQTVSGVSSDVAVSFDGRAVPYIASRSDGDAYLAQGFVTARDRIFQMDMLRRSALGELSEVYGASCLPSDRLMHTLGIRKLAYAEYNHLSAPAKAALDEYARGVNEYLNINNGNLPLQFAFLGYTPRTWHPEDSLAILKYRAYKLDESWRLDDFRQRVANKVGDELASQLFRDDLVDYGLPPEPAPTPNGAESGLSPAATTSPTDGSGGKKPAVHSGNKQSPLTDGSGRRKPALNGNDKQSTDGSGRRKPALNGNDKQSTDGSGGRKPALRGNDKQSTDGSGGRKPAVHANDNQTPSTNGYAAHDSGGRKPSSSGSGGRKPALRGNDNPTPAPDGSGGRKPAPSPSGGTPLDPVGFNPAVDKLLAMLSQQADAAHKNMGLSPLMGSTTWAVPAGNSATGGAMLGCNSDGALTSPSDWYICSLNSPGLHIAGASLPGVPGVIIGRNEDVSWGASALKADVQDIFLEQFKSQFDLSYKTADGWKQATTDTELIASRFGKDVEHKVVATAHGPVLLRNKDMAVSLSWTGFDTDRPSFEALYKLNRAGSIDQCVGALSTFNDPPTMFVLADRWGNIACHAAGNVPVRADGGTGTQLTPGWQSKGAWESMVPYNQLPLAVVTFTPGGSSNSKSPIIAANQAPATTGEALPKSDSSVMLGHQWASPYRANRLLSALSKSKSAISLGDMVALAGDQFTELAPVVSPALTDAALAAHLADRNALYATELLAHWDGQMRSDATEAAIYESFIQTLGRRLVEPKLGRQLTTEYMQRWPLWLTFAQSAVQNKPVVWLSPEERSYDNFFITTLTQALKSLRITCDTSNPQEWLWGRVHLAAFDPIGAAGTWFAPFYSIGPVATSGAAECINSCDVAYDPAALSFASTNGPTQRMIVDMHDHDQFYQCINSGQSAQLTSEYRKDQLKSWAAVDYFPVAFSPSQLMKLEKHRLTLTNQEL